MKKLIEMKEWAETRYEKEREIVEELKKKYPDLVDMSFTSYDMFLSVELFSSTINYSQGSYQIKPICDGNIPETEDEIRAKMKIMLEQKESIENCSKYVIGILSGENNEEL